APRRATGRGPPPPPAPPSPPAPANPPRPRPRPGGSAPGTPVGPAPRRDNPRRDYPHTAGPTGRMGAYRRRTCPGRSRSCTTLRPVTAAGSWRRLPPGRSGAVRLHVADTAGRQVRPGRGRSGVDAGPARAPAAGGVVDFGGHLQRPAKPRPSSASPLRTSRLRRRFGTEVPWRPWRGPVHRPAGGHADLDAGAVTDWSDGLVCNHDS